MVYDSDELLYIYGLKFRPVTMHIWFKLQTSYHIHIYGLQFRRVKHGEYTRVYKYNLVYGISERVHGTSLCSSIKTVFAKLTEYEYKPIRRSTWIPI